MRYAYLHGFSSSPDGHKVGILRERFAEQGLHLERPALHRPSFEMLTYTASLEVLDEMDDVRDEPWCLIGSSMGGYLAARWAELNPARVVKLLLLCPAFGLTERWPQLLGEEAFSRWKRDGSFGLPAPGGGVANVHWGFIEDARQHPAYPEVPCPTVIVHGRRDEVVPIEQSRRYAAERDHVVLHEVDDDHGLSGTVDVIDAVAREHFASDEG